MGMSNGLLVQYLRMAVKEAHLARVPNQLVSTDTHDGEWDEDQGDDVTEFCGVAGGGLQGFSGPLGAGKARRKKRKP
jgi:hypothetical protein